MNTEMCRIFGKFSCPNRQVASTGSTELGLEIRDIYSNDSHGEEKCKEIKRKRRGEDDGSL